MMIMNSSAGTHTDLRSLIDMARELADGAKVAATLAELEAKIAESNAALETAQAAQRAVESETDRARQMLAQARLVEQQALEREREVTAAHDECAHERVMVEIKAHAAETMKADAEQRAEEVALREASLATAIADHQRKVDDLRRLSAVLA